MKILITVLAVGAVIKLGLIIITAAEYDRLWNAYQIMLARYRTAKKTDWKDLDAHLPSGGSTGRWNDDEPNWNAKE